MRKKKELFRVVPFTNPSGDTVWRVTGWKSGQRVRENYKSEEEAHTRKTALEIQVSNISSQAKVAITRLSPSNLVDAENAIARLHPVYPNATLAECVDHYIATYRPNERKMNVEEGVAKFFQEKQAANKRLNYIKMMQYTIAKLVEAHPKRYCHEITANDLRDLIQSAKRGPSRQLHMRKHFHTFFQWALRNEFISANPVARIQAPTVEFKEPTILGNKECAKLLETARRFEEGQLLGYVVLALFGGIRPEEIKRSTWSDFVAENSCFVVRSSAAKLRGRRHVELSANALAWLKLVPANTPLWPARGVYLLKKLRLAAGFAKWPKDVLRHTAITHKIGITNDENATATWAGNSPGILHAHYRGLCPKSQSEAFWKIMPK